MELIIGDKLWSSWSMRPWLALRATGSPFRETLVRLRGASAEETARAARAAGSPSGLVPALKDGDIVVWDSLAICEYLAECFPAAALWPRDPRRAPAARAAAAEMHAGFAALRGECPMELPCARAPMSSRGDPHATCAAWSRLWTELLARFGGPLLVGGGWTIADAFFTPVATRIRSYGLDLGGSLATMERPRRRLRRAAARPIPPSAPGKQTLWLTRRRPS